MALINTKGIVLRNLKYSETSVILDIYTEARGLKSYIVSGVRTPKAKIGAGLLQVMSMIEMVAYDRNDQPAQQKNSLQRIKELRAGYIYQRLPFEMKRMATGLFIAEVLQHTLRESETNPPLFQFIQAIFEYIDRSEESLVNLHIIFLLQLSAYLGFQPQSPEPSEFSQVFDLREGVFNNGFSSGEWLMTQGSSRILAQFLRLNDWKKSHEIPLQRTERQRLLDDLLRFYHYHIPNFKELNAHRVLQEILQ